MNIEKNAFKAFKNSKPFQESLLANLQKAGSKYQILEQV